MTEVHMPNIIDLHCDTLTAAYGNKRSLCCREHHFSLDRLPKGFNWCQCMAIFIPDELRGQVAADYFDAVHNFYREQLAEYSALIREIGVLSSVSEELPASLFTSILTVEGGAVLAGDPANVERLYNMGVRMLTLTWNDTNELCGGVLSGGGFTQVGRDTVKRMEKTGVIVDVSHISDKGFAELCNFAQKPFIASHSNARSICSHPRNLTDSMFCEIIDRRGIVGLNYYDNFIVDGGGSTDIADLIRHVHHFLELGGENVIALGSDYDGADMPPYICGIEHTQHLIDSLERSGIPKETVQKLLYKNAANFFKRL